jgi:Cysteine rich repeat
MTRIALVVAVVLALTSSGANAQSEAQPPGAPATEAPGASPPGASPPAARPVLAACNADLAQFCGGVQPGGGRIKACIKQHFRQLSPGCKQAVMQARRQQ